MPLPELLETATLPAPLIEPLSPKVVPFASRVKVFPEATEALLVRVSEVSVCKVPLPVIDRDPEPREDRGYNFQ